jgi:hypothetical protein
MLKIMSNVCPIRMKWHFKDSRFKNFPGEDALGHPYEVLNKKKKKCLFQDSAPAAFQSFRRPWEECDNM